MTSVVAYACLWLSFGLGHSLLTVPLIKRRLEPLFGPAYRLSYNVFAAIHIGLVFLVGRYLLNGSRFTFFSSPIFIAVSVAVMLCGALLILLSLRQYDLGQFSGLSQLRNATTAKDDGTVTEKLNIGGLNGWVRHPLYSGLFLFAWGNATSPLGFWTAVFASAYLLIGAHYEERKLVSVYGNAYHHYKMHTPAFVPRRKRA